MGKDTTITKPYLIILNPVAGKGNALKLLPQVEAYLAEYAVPFELVQTEYPGHAIELTQQACNGTYGGIVAAGGDGTGNEVINGLMKAREAGKDIPPFGVLCVGRGNDLAYGAGIPGDLKEGCRRLAAPQLKAMDVGLVVGGDYPEGRYFGNGIGIGFDTIVGLEAARMTRVHGFLAYVFGAVKTLIMFPKPPLVEVRTPAETFQKKSAQLSIMNGRRMGGTFFMAPEAKNDDGMFDICMAEQLNRREMISLIVKYTKGTQAESPRIWTGRTTGLTVKALEGGLVVHADGETICIDGKELKVECLRHRIEVIDGKKDEPAALA